MVTMYGSRVTEPGGDRGRRPDPGDVAPLSPRPRPARSGCLARGRTSCRSRSPDGVRPSARRGCGSGARQSPAGPARGPARGPPSAVHQDSPHVVMHLHYVGASPYQAVDGAPCTVVRSRDSRQVRRRGGRDVRPGDPGSGADRPSSGQALDQWDEELAPAPSAGSGRTGGVTEDGRFIAPGPFRVRGRRPAQQRTARAGPVVGGDRQPVRRRADIPRQHRRRRGHHGDPDAAGFVQVIQGRSTDPDRAGS